MKQFNIAGKIFISLVIILVSCKKGNNNVTASANIDYLTQQAWKISKYEQKTNSSGTYVDQFPTVPVCSRDDEYKFDPSYTYQLTEGATKCNSSDPNLIFTGF